MFIAACILLVAAIVAGIVSSVLRHGDPSVKLPRMIAFGLTGLGVMCLVFSSIAIVGANSVGVNVGFGTYYGALGSGPHLVAPWSDVEEFSTREQTAVRNKVANESEEDKSSDCVVVKATGVEACVDLTLRWNIRNGDETKKPDGTPVPANPREATDQIEQLWRVYGTFDAVTDKLINNEINNAAAIVYGGYQPTDAFSGAKTEEIAGKLLGRLDVSLGKYGINVAGITLGAPHLEKDDQDNLNRLIGAQQDVEIARLGVDKANLEAEANRNRQPSLSPEALVNKCLDTAKEVRPLVITCYPGSQSPQVILPQPAPAPAPTG